MEYKIYNIEYKVDTIEYSIKISSIHIFRVYRVYNMEHTT